LDNVEITRISGMSIAPEEILSSTACVQVCYSPREVWVQPNQGAIISMEERIRDLDIDTTPVTYVNPGDNLLVLFDLKWNRATVVSKYPNGSIFVRFNDYGNCADVTLDKVVILPESLIQPPPLAVKCALDGSDKYAFNLEKFQQVLFCQQLTVKVVKKTADHLVVRFFRANGMEIFFEPGPLLAKATLTTSSRKQTKAKRRRCGRDDEGYNRMIQEARKI